MDLNHRSTGYEPGGISWLPYLAANDQRYEHSLATFRQFRGVQSRVFCGWMLCSFVGRTTPTLTRLIGVTPIDAVYMGIFNHRYHILPVVAGFGCPISFPPTGQETPQRIQEFMALHRYFLLWFHLHESTIFKEFIMANMSMSYCYLWLSKWVLQTKYSILQRYSEAYKWLER